MQFFDTQFRNQIASRDFKLNPFEMRALDFVRGSVLDVGCGLGNLALEAARRGCEVFAVDSSQAAIDRIVEAANEEELSISARAVDLNRWNIDQDYSTIVSIGVLMFLPRERSYELLRDIQRHVAPGGCAIINVLVEGTSYMDMFQAGCFYLYSREELEQLFAGWAVLSVVHESFPAPGDTRKEFTTVIASKLPVAPPEHSV